jgi:hypothetical protein
MAENSDPSARVSSPGSWAAGNPFVGNGGPAFDPETAEQPAAPTPLEVVEIRWEPDRVKTILRGQGLLTHEAVGVAVDDWAWRDSELLAISEPLANSMNKIPVVRAAAAVSDELTAGAVLFEYAARSIRDRRRAMQAQINAERAAQQQRRRAQPAAAPEAHTFDMGAPAPPAAPQPDPDVKWRVPE